MSDPTWQLIAIVLYFAAMAGIGVWSFTRTGDKGDYMLGGRGLGVEMQRKLHTTRDLDCTDPALRRARAKYPSRSYGLPVASPRTVVAGLRVGRQSRSSMVGEPLTSSTCRKPTRS